MLQDYLYSSFVVLLSLLFSLIAPYGGIKFFTFQMIVGIIFYFNSKSKYNLIFIMLILYLIDTILHVNPAFSIISFSVGGLIISLISKSLPILKQQPFISARIFWLVISSIIFEFFNLKSITAIFNLDSISGLILTIIILVILTVIIEPNFQRKKNAEISIS